MFVKNSRNYNPVGLVRDFRKDNLTSVRCWRRICLVYLCVGMLGGACRSVPPEVEEALNLAGDNRTELQQVLDYYRGKDDLKYEAACFLMANMPYHRSEINLEVAPVYWSFFHSTDSLFRKLGEGGKEEWQKKYTTAGLDSMRQYVAQQYDSLPECLKFPGQPDIKVIQAAFLIENIESAFLSWKTSPLLKNISFEDFKEIVLPYRTTDEPLLAGREQLRDLLYPEIAKGGMDIIYRPVERYKQYMADYKWLMAKVTRKHRTALFDARLPMFKMDCYNLTTWTCNYFRACGIPVVFDYTEQWPDKNSRHFWCVSPDSNEVWQPYTVPYCNLGEDWEISLRFVGKVYRRTFGMNRESPFFVKNKVEFVPEQFDVPTIKDVTKNYHPTVILHLPWNNGSRNCLAYLCFFSSSGFHAVAWGKTNSRHKEVVFEQVPLQMLFFPAYYNGNRLEFFSSPFMLKAEKQIPYKKLELRLKRTDLYTVRGKRKKVRGINYCVYEVQDSVISMLLGRKYPPKPALVALREKLRGGVVMGTDDLKEEGDTLFCLKTVPGDYMQEYRLLPNSYYRYYYFKIPDNEPVNLAEIEFLADFSGNTTTLAQPLTAFGDADTCRSKLIGEPMRSGPQRRNAFDGDPETYVESVFVGMDFKKPVKVTHVRLLPRNANNRIVPGDDYELLYYKSGQWVSCGRKQAKYNYLVYDQVPAGTLYWLRDLSRGKEELPFFYEKGRQVFINEGIE